MEFSLREKANRSELQTNDDIWKAVLSANGEYIFMTDDEKRKNFLILFNYFCELESGGQDWFLEHVEEMGIQTYLNGLTIMLEKVEVHTQK